MIADWEMTEAARLLERACGLLALHRESNHGVRFFIRQWKADASALRSMARHERERTRCESGRLLA